MIEKTSHILKEFDMDARELLARYAAGERNFCGLNLERLKLANMFYEMGGPILPMGPIDLSHSDFTGAWVGQSQIGPINLQGAILRDAQLTESWFFGCNLRGADLRDASGSEVNFTQADLEGADLRGANFIHSSFRDCNLRKTNLEGAILDFSCIADANFEDAILTDTSFYEITDKAIFND